MLKSSLAECHYARQCTGNECGVSRFRRTRPPRTLTKRCVCLNSRLAGSNLSTRPDAASSTSLQALLSLLCYMSVRDMDRASVCSAGATSVNFWQLSRSRVSCFRAVYLSILSVWPSRCHVLPLLQCARATRSLPRQRPTTTKSTSAIVENFASHSTRFLD